MKKELTEQDKEKIKEIDLWIKESGIEYRAIKKSSNRARKKLYIASSILIAYIIFVIYYLSI